MRTRFHDNMGLRSQRLADLRSEAAELERRLTDARVSLERELAQPAGSEDAPAGHIRSTRRCPAADADHGPGADGLFDLYATPGPSQAYRSASFGDPAYGSATSGDPGSPDRRTEVLVSHGRRSAYRPDLSLGRKIAIAAAAVAVLIVCLVETLGGGGASWPSTVLRVQSEAARACQNPDVRSEPGQVDFACAKTTRQILWVLALMTSDDNPKFADKKTGRVGLEPITPAQGGEVAWSLNLHHPYSPSNPIDSLAVAARAINNIIGGATLTGANGSPAVQSGLEGNSANCVRYTGSAALTSRAGFPKLCARPVISQAGQAALVADVYQRWIVGASPQAAQDAAVLFENADNPGDPRVQAVLKHLSDLKPLG